MAMRFIATGYLLICAQLCESCVGRTEVCVCASDDLMRLMAALLKTWLAGSIKDSCTES